MTISQVSKKYDLTPDTIRYYEKVGLITNIPRTKSGIRNFDEEAYRTLEFIKCMRNAGVEIEILLQYMKLYRKGKTTINERKELLQEQRLRLIKKQNEIAQTIQRLDYKLQVYDEIISGKRNDFTEI